MGIDEKSGGRWEEQTSGLPCFSCCHCDASVTPGEDSSRAAGPDAMLRIIGKLFEENLVLLGETAFIPLGMEQLSYLGIVTPRVSSLSVHLSPCPQSLSCFALRFATPHPGPLWPHHGLRIVDCASEAEIVDPVPRLGEQSPSSPQRRRLGVRHTSMFFGGGGPIPLCLTASVMRGAFFLLDRGAVSVAGAEGTAVGGSDSGRVSGPSCGSPQLRRPLGEPSVRAGGPFRRCA
ncbi:unnamed protein product [Pleuronectes platessa]|uniref:Uncharacterized protein n=1 Tax=Pleuronectes platessa TaxID=8262 RepID=A0A9N7Z9J8_PLEPL|nr:unnamed protein product [Pleuronectes platessa]